MSSVASCVRQGCMFTPPKTEVTDLHAGSPYLRLLKRRLCGSAISRKVVSGDSVGRSDSEDCRSVAQAAAAVRGRYRTQPGAARACSERTSRLAVRFCGFATSTQNKMQKAFSAFTAWLLASLCLSPEEALCAAESAALALRALVRSGTSALPVSVCHHLRAECFSCVPQPPDPSLAGG